MSDQSSNLGLPFLMPAQAQKHVTVNESLLRLDALLHLAVESAATTAQPGTPTDGARYILPAGKTGDDWGAMAEAAVAYYRDGAWEQLTPREGWFAFVKDTDETLVFDGAAWISEPIAIPEGAVTLDRLVDAAAQYMLLARASAGAGDWEELASSADVFALLAAADNSAIRSAIGVYSQSETDSEIAGALAGLGALAALDTVGTSDIDDDAVTFDKLLNATQASYIGATGAGAFSERTPAQVLADIAALPLAGGTMAGHILASADNTWDLGSATNRLRTVYGRTILGGANVSAGLNNSFSWGNISRSSMSSPADGVIIMANVAVSGFGSLLLGPSGTTYTRLKHAGTGLLQGRLADDSDFAFLQAKLRTHADAASETITPDSTLTLYDAAGTAYKVPCVAA